MSDSAIYYYFIAYLTATGNSNAEISVNEPITSIETIRDIANLITADLRGLHNYSGPTVVITNYILLRTERE